MTNDKKKCKKLRKTIKALLRFCPDRAYIMLQFYRRCGSFCNLKHPKTYNEKINWLKLYDRDPLYIRIVDKYDVKEYIASKIGAEYVIPTIGIWDRFDEIDFDMLPEQFVLKCTHDSGGIVIVRDKSTMDRKAAEEKIEKARKNNYYYHGREWPYKKVMPRIIAEPYLQDQKTGQLIDYKFFCFSGEPKALFIATDRDIGETKFDYFDVNFNHLELRQYYPNSTVLPAKPSQFDKMVELARELSKDLLHVRVDFYEVDGRIYVGELTLHHFSGFVPFQPHRWDEVFGDWLRLPIDT